MVINIFLSFSIIREGCQTGINYEHSTSFIKYNASFFYTCLWLYFIFTYNITTTHTIYEFQLAEVFAIQKLNHAL